MAGIRFLVEPLATTSAASTHRLLEQLHSEEDHLNEAVPALKKVTQENQLTIIVLKYQSVSP